MKAKITDLQRKETIAMCKQGVRQEDIAKKYDLSTTRVSQIARENGIKRGCADVAAGEKKCSACGSRNPSKARFCMNCGADIRDEKQIATEQLMRLREMIVLLPESVQGEADEITRNALKLLGGR